MDKVKRMSRTARSVFYFSLYLLLTGAALFLFPAFIDSLLKLGLSSQDYGWLRLAGILAGVIGTYYFAAAFYDHKPICRLTVYVRIAAAVLFMYLVVARQLPPAFLLFAAIDAAGAIWTHLCTKSDR